MTVGEHIRRERLAAGLNQTDLGRRIGIAQVEVSRYETGRVEPSLRSLRRIAAALGIEPGELLAEEEHENTKGGGDRCRS